MSTEALPPCALCGSEPLRSPDGLRCRCPADHCPLSGRSLTLSQWRLLHGPRIGSDGVVLRGVTIPEQDLDGLLEAVLGTPATEPKETGTTRDTVAEARKARKVEIERCYCQICGREIPTEYGMVCTDCARDVR